MLGAKETRRYLFSVKILPYEQVQIKAAMPSELFDVFMWYVNVRAWISSADHYE